MFSPTRFLQKLRISNNKKMKLPKSQKINSTISAVECCFLDMPLSLLLTKSKARPWKAIIGNRIQDSNIAISDKLSDL